MKKKRITIHLTNPQDFKDDIAFYNLAFYNPFFSEKDIEKIYKNIMASVKKYASENELFGFPVSKTSERCYTFRCDKGDDNKLVVEYVGIFKG